MHLEEGGGEVKGENRAIALLAGFEVVEEPPHVRHEQITDLRFLLERWVDLGKRVFQVPVLVGEGKRGPDLFEI